MLPANGQNLKLGKGSLLLAELLANGNLKDNQFVGNATAISLSAEVTKAEIYSSTQQSAPLLGSSVTRVKYTVSMTLSEFSLENLKKFLLGESATRSQAIGTNSQVAFSTDEVRQGAYLDVDARQITNVTVTRDNTDLTTETTDYVVYPEFGLIYVVPGGAIQTGDTVTVEFDQPALTIDQVRIAKVGSRICRLTYVADDANTDGAGAHDRLILWRVNVAPEGELGVVSDEYASFQLTAEVLSDAADHPNDPFGVLERVRAA